MITIRKILEKRDQLVIRAFTLLESLLVLMITSFVLLLFTGSITKIVHVVRGELFVVQFENNYKNVQFLATATRQPQLLSASGNKLIYGNKTNSIPPEVRIDAFSIKFDEKGNNSSLKKLNIFLPFEQKTISYQLEMGSGKYKKTINE